MKIGAERTFSRRLKTRGIFEIEKQKPAYALALVRVRRDECDFARFHS
jgi:hypothetical protein